MAEKRLADVDALLEEIDRTIDIMEKRRDRLSVRNVIMCVKNAPRVDAVEVVRCKDCKKYNGHRYCTYFCETVLDNDFCSYGERKDNG